MSLTQGLRSPRTPMRRFLDQELSAGAGRVRAEYRARLPAAAVLLPGEGVGFEAGTVGTAIDQRLRLSFTCASAVDEATEAGIARCLEVATVYRERQEPRPSVWSVLAQVGHDLVTTLAAQVGDLELDARNRSLTRTHEAEERLARLLLAGAWYALNLRNPFAFPDTPLFQAALESSERFTLERLLAVPSPALVEDVLAQVHAAESGPLEDLRQRTSPRQCIPGPTFEGSADISADADLIVDGVLIDFKSTRHVQTLPKTTVHQLLGYVLLDYSDHYRIDMVGLYLTRAGALVAWPLEDYLALLGARRRDLVELRSLFNRLVAHPDWLADEDPLPHQGDGVDRFLAQLAAVAPNDCCLVCTQPLGQRTRRSRLYCSPFCSRRAPTLRKHGWLAVPECALRGRSRPLRELTM
ncbi:hypothetical protein ACEZCY_33885 [Streptacidiphilus sp. N1-12]|uniref:Uncharacterized protein n=2 Tax=Streptacidiphilus alkalitolerans TaxID=3342712 RepID=A0ABV6WQ72_9ACTN